MSNKKGQGLSTNAIILIILGVIILVVLALGFMIGWNKLLPFLPSDKVETIKSSFASACTTENVYGFCSQERTLKADGLPLDANGKAQKSVTKNCKFFATTADYTKYGIVDCPNLCA